MEVHWKIGLLEGGFTKNQFRGEDCLKRGGLGQFANITEAWQVRGGVFLRGVDTPMHTTAASCNYTLGPAKVPECAPRLFGIECCF